MPNPRRTWTALGVAVGLSLLLTALIPGASATHRPGVKYRWDIVSIDTSTNPPTVRPGGIASATANDNSKITLTGSGSFRTSGRHGRPSTSGGGSWTTSNAAGARTGGGRYRVTRLVSWDKAPGSGPPLTDSIGARTRTPANAGLAVLRVAYSDGQQGNIAISCHLVGTPDSMYEGITAAKGFVHYFNREKPSDEPFVNANRTVFHKLR